MGPLNYDMQVDRDRVLVFEAQFKIFRVNELSERNKKSERHMKRNGRSSSSYRTFAVAS
jgi:hypothetical protein